MNRLQQRRAVPVGIPMNGLLAWHRFHSPNVLLQSNNFGTAPWSATRATPVQSASVLAPSGSLAWKLVEDNTAGNTHYLGQPWYATATAWECGLWMKAAERTWAQIRTTDGAPAVKAAHFNLETGAVGTVSAGMTATCTASGLGFFCKVRVASPTAGTGSIIVRIAEADNDTTFNGTGSAPYTEADPGLYIAAAQLYPGSLPPYAPTTTLQSIPSLVPGNAYPLTRGSNPTAADSADPTLLGPGMSFDGGDYCLSGALSGITLAGPWTAIAVAKSTYAGDGYIFSLADLGSTNNYAGFYMDSATTALGTWNAAGSAAWTGAITAVDGGIYCWALTADSTLRLRNLSLGTTSNVAAAKVPTGTPRIGVGGFSGSTPGSPIFNTGNIYSVLLYNRALSLAELQRIFRVEKSWWAQQGVTIL